MLETNHCDVAVIGAGPAGLSAAIELKKNGIEQVVVLDRETVPGGIPRHCGHPSFGILEYKRIMTGPPYARRIAQTATQAGADLILKASVTHISPNKELTLVTPNGTGTLKAKRVLLATGARETPRSARLVAGKRFAGVTTTGALQSMFYLKGIVPFKNPVIVGTEIVSFSALLTCRKAGIKPAAMIEPHHVPSVSWPFHHGAGLVGVPLFLNTSIVDIFGRNRVEGIKIVDNIKKNTRKITCDGVVFTGMFTPESTLARMGHLKLDPTTQSPVVDKFNRCSDPAFFAAGNLLPPLNTAMNCWRQGRKTAQMIIKDLAGQLDQEK